MRSAGESRVGTSEWAELVASDPASTFYHEAVWLECLDAAYPYFHPLYLLDRDPAGRILGGIPAIRSVRAGLEQLFSLPYGTYGHPLVGTRDVPGRRAVRHRLLRSWERAARAPRVVRAHLVLFEDGADDGGLPPARRLDEETLVIDLAGGFDAVWKRFDGDKRTECRKAERAGVIVEDVTGSRGAAILESLYRRQAGQWTNHTAFPPRLIHELVDRAPDTVRVWVARRDETPLSAQMVFHHRRGASTWLTCSTPEARPLGAGNLLYRAVIEDACRRGHVTYNLGGNQGSDDLRKYKLAFGATPRRYASYLFESGWFRPLHRLQYRLRGIKVQGGV